MSTQNLLRRGPAWLALLLAFTLIVAACSSDDDDAADDASTTTAASAADETVEPAAETVEPADEPAEEPEEPAQIAYLSASSANTWLAASREAMEDVGATANVEFTEFDAQFNADMQSQQFQDAITSGQYDGIMLVALAGAGAIPDVQTALDAGLEVVVLNQVVGDDFTTVEPQVPGIAAAVFEPPFVRGERIGQLTLMACADRDPCNVVYFYGVRGLPLDEAVRAGWDSAVEGSTVEVVAEGEGQYLGPDVGLAAMQDILVSTSDIDVVLGADQSMQGVELALDGADGIGDIRIIGFGGSSYSVEAVSDGRWWGGLFGAPYTEGRLAMEAMVEALNGNDVGGIDPSGSVPNGGLMTQDNVGDYTAEWDG